MKDYIVARLLERDTRVVVGAAIYSILRIFVPVEYVYTLDTLASILGFGVVATPNKN